MSLLALISLRPDAKWKWVGEDYADIEWLDEVQTKPTLAEYNAEVARLKEKAVSDKQAEATAKQAAEAKLAKLGLTADDLKAILG